MPREGGGHGGIAGELTVAAMAAAPAAGVAAGRALPPSGAAALLLVVTAAACGLGGAGRRRAACLLAAGCALAALGAWRGAGVRPPAVPPQGAATLSGSVREIATAGIVVDVDPGYSGAGISSVLVVPRRGGAPAVEPGDAVQVQTASLRPPGLRPGPRSQDSLERLDVDAVASGASLTVTGVAWWPAHVLGVAHDAVVSAVERDVPEPAAALLLGVAFGWHRPLDSASRVALQDAGLVHIVAVSGLKVVIVLALLETALLRLPLRRRTRVAILLAGLCVFVVVSGGGAAALRSGMTASLALLLRRDGRRPRPFAVLALCASTLLLVWPSMLGDTGFRLSFLGTAGILLLADPLIARLPGPRLLVEPFALTVAAQVATLPVMASTFGSISLVGPFANALVLPLLPLLIAAGWAGGGLAVALPVLGGPILALGGAGCELALGTARLLAAVPGAALHPGRWPLAWTLGEVAALAVAAAVSIGRRRGATEEPA